MNRESLIAHLQQVERHVAEGERHLERQRQLVEELERDGYPSKTSRILLDLFEQLQAEHEADRQRLASKLRGKR